MNISDLYNRDIYTDGGQFLGEVKDAIVDLEKGEIGRLLMSEWRGKSTDETRKMLQNKSVLFKNVRNIGDVVLVTVAGQAAKVPEHEMSSEYNEISRR
jgi:sporulation protein YlmC with PRC-barrel domain